MTYDAHYDDTYRDGPVDEQSYAPPTHEQYHVPVPIQGMPPFVENYASHVGTHIVDWPHLQSNPPGMLLAPDTYTSSFPPSSSSSGSTTSLRIAPVDVAAGEHALPESDAGAAAASRKSRRVPVACQECRTRKSRCDGGRPCSVCISSGRGDTCRYQHSARRVWILQSEWLALEGERDELRKRCAGLQAQLEERGGGARGRAGAPDAAWGLAGSGRLLVDDAGVSRYMGETSGAAFYSSLIDTLPKLLPPDTSSMVPTPHHSHQYQSWDSRALPVARQPVTELPPLAVAQHLISVFREHCLDPWSWIEVGQLEWLVADIYGINRAPLRPQNQDHFTRFALLYVVLALGAMFDDQQAKLDEAPGMHEYFSRAYALLNGHGGRATVERVRVASLASWYLLCAIRRDAAFALIGDAIRMAVSLGLHRKDAEQEPSQVEDRRRLFWSAVCLDWLVSCMLGRPCQLSSDEIDVPLPSKGRDHIETCRISSRIPTTLFAPSAGHHYYCLESAHNLLTELDDLGVVAGSQRTDLLLQLHRLGVVNIITRHAVLALLGGAGTTSPEVRQLAQRCVASARQSARVFSQLAVRPWGLYETHFAYNAGVILAIAPLLDRDEERDDEGLGAIRRVLVSQAVVGNASAGSSLAILHSLEAIERRVHGPQQQTHVPIGWFGLTAAQQQHAAAAQHGTTDGDSAALQALLGSFL